MTAEVKNAAARMVRVQTTEQRAREGKRVVVRQVHEPASRERREQPAKLTRVVVSSAGKASADQPTAKRISAEDVEKVLRGEAKARAMLQRSQRRQRS